VSSKLQRRISDLLSIHLGKYTIRENYRPEWLSTNDGGRLELDFYIDELNLAIEVQGRQHYVFVPLFHHDHDDFKAQLERDRTKRRICEGMGIKLLEASSESDVLDFILSIGNIKDEYVHPNAVTCIKVSKRRKRNKRSHDRWGYGYNSETVQKHLRKLRLTISHCQYGKMAWENCKALMSSLQALDYYQEATEPIEFSEHENKMFDAARELISNFHIAYLGNE